MNAITPKSIPMPQLHTGDVIACWGTDRVSRVISLMTCSLLPPLRFAWAPSHVAIIHREGSTDPQWYESTTMVGTTRGAQDHCPRERWQAYGGRCVVLRPTVVLDGEQRDRMGIALRQMVREGVPYDMAGAILSGTRFLRYFVPASGERLFCSELVARTLMVAQLMNWSSPAGYSPGRLCRELVSSGAFEVVR